MIKEYSIKNLHCGGCAAKIERSISALDGVEEAGINFMTKKLTVNISEERAMKLIEVINKIGDDIEPGTIFEETGNIVKKIKIRLSGLHCGGCAAKIEDKVSKMELVKEADLNFSKQILNVKMDEEADEEKYFQRIKKIVNSMEPDVKVEYFQEEIASELSYHHDHSHAPLIKKEIIILATGGIIFIAGLFMGDHLVYKKILMTLGYLLVGHDIVLSSFKNIKRGNFIDENFLMTIATFGAFAVGEYSEAVGVMLFYKIGEYFQDRAVENSRRSIEGLMDIRPDYANIKTPNGDVKKVSPEKVVPGDIILVKPGEKVPLDGRVTKGNSVLDTSALTGESLPVDVREGDEVLSGTLNKNGTLEVEVVKEFSESTVSKILELVENASSKKAKAEKFITKFARYYTPIVVGLALSIAFVLPIFLGNFSQWFYRALIFLVISCPCALLVSIPLTFFSGIGAASKRGILVKGGNYLEELNGVKAVVFDKTGTLTKGKFKVMDIVAFNIEEKELLELAAAGERYSNHPIAKSISEAFEGDIKDSDIEEHYESEGSGIEAVYRGDRILAGNSRLLKKHDIEFQVVDLPGTVVYLAKNGKYEGYILIADEIRTDSKRAVKELREIGIESYMLTGDSRGIAKNIGKELGIERIHWELLPKDKVDHFQMIKEEVDGTVIFVGDGINDAPVLALSDIGVAMGGIGSDAAVEAADIVIMKDEPSKLREVLDISRDTRKIVIQNITLAFGVKLLVMILGVGGHATMWEAIFADVGVALMAVLNSTRVLKK